MTERDDNRAYMVREAARRPDGWEAINIAAFGLEGSLDLLELQAGRPYNVDLRHRPFVNDRELKYLLAEARIADLALCRRIHEIQNDAWDKARSS